MLHDEIRHIAELSRLNPDPSQLERFARQCTEILGYVDVLGEVDTTGVEPLYSPVDHACAFREDTAVERTDRERMLANAPETDGAFFIVPKIV